MGIMTAAGDWKVLVDLDKQLKFPQEVQVQTTLRPDLIMYLPRITIRRVILFQGKYDRFFFETPPNY